MESKYAKHCYKSIERSIWTISLLLYSMKICSWVVLLQSNWKLWKGSYEKDIWQVIDSKQFCTTQNSKKFEQNIWEKSYLSKRFSNTIFIFVLTYLSQVCVKSKYAEQSYRFVERNSNLLELIYTNCNNRFSRFEQ